MIGPAPMCMWCVHFRDDIGPVDEEGGHTGPLACMAFLNGIPDVIIDNDFDHRQPYPDDNDVRFEPKSDTDSEVLDLIDQMFPSK